MKKFILTLAVIALSLASLLAQGTINYNIRVPGLLISHVYSPDGFVMRSGNTPAETPSGTQFYLGELLSGPGWSAELFAAAGSGQPASALVPVANSITTFRTGTLRGTIVPSILTVPFIAAGGTGTFQLRAWDNRGGTLTSWAAAEPAWEVWGIAAGYSLPFDIENLGTDINQPANMVNFRSFNLVILPEPSISALLLLGAFGLHMLRRE